MKESENDFLFYLLYRKKFISDNVFALFWIESIAAKFYYSILFEVLQNSWIWCGKLHKTCQVYLIGNKITCQGSRIC